MKYHTFDNYNGFINGHIDYISHQDPNGNYKLEDVGLENKNSNPVHLTELLTSKAIEHLNSINNKPVFMMVSYANPHIPIILPGEKAIFPGKTDDAVNTPERYQQLVNFLDLQIGKLVSAVYKKNENSMIIFISDQGCPDNLKGNYPYAGGKGNLFEGGIKSPALIQWPGKIKPSEINEFCSSLELYNTILAAAEYNTPDTTSVSYNLFNRNKNSTTEFIWTFNNQIAVRKGEWKALFIEIEDRQGNKNKFLDFTPVPPFETKINNKLNYVWLFNLSDDPTEKNNEAEKNPLIINELLELVNSGVKTQNK